MSDENDFEDDDKYPWEDVEAARKNRRLQRKHPIADGQISYMAVAKPCPQCGTAAGQLSWLNSGELQFLLKHHPHSFQCRAQCEGSRAPNHTQAARLESGHGEGPRGRL